MKINFPLVMLMYGILLDKKENKILLKNIRYRLSNHFNYHFFEMMCSIIIYNFRLVSQINYCIKTIFVFSNNSYNKAFLQIFFSHCFFYKFHIFPDSLFITEMNIRNHCTNSVDFRLINDDNLPLRSEQ